MLRWTTLLTLTFLLVFASACSMLPPNLPSATATQPVETLPAAPTALPATQTPAGGDNSAPANGMADLNVFSQKLAAAFTTRDYATLRGLMGERFVHAYWRSEGSEMAPDAAIDSLKNSLLSPGSNPHADFQADPVALLDGADPLRLMAPENGVRALVVRGLGAQAKDEAMLIIARDPTTNQFYFHSVLGAFMGFQQDNGSLGDLDLFSTNLAAAIENRDFTNLRSMMGAQFVLAGWRSEGGPITPDQAITRLQNDILPGQTRAAADFTTDPAALLDGADPLRLMVSDGTGVRAFLIRGVGVQGADEALVIIARDPDSGKFYWQGLLTAFGGFAPAAPSSTQPEQ